MIRILSLLVLVLTVITIISIIKDPAKPNGEKLPWAIIVLVFPASARYCGLPSGRAIPPIAGSSGRILELGCEHQGRWLNVRTISDNHPCAHR